MKNLLNVGGALDLVFADANPADLDRLAATHARRRSVIYVAVSLTGLSWACGAQAGSIVVPGAYATMDTNTALYRENLAQLRFQQLYEAAEFSALGGPVLITGYAARPHAAQSTPASVSVAGFDCWLSTTSRTVSTLSSTFAHNRGADQTLVESSDAAVVYTTANLPGGGSTKQFDIVQMFSTPFRYDPAAGNLLMEARVTGTTLVSGREFLTSACSTGPSSRVRMVISIDSADAASGVYQDVGEIDLFLYEPIAAADFNQDGVVDSADLAQWAGAYGVTAAGDADADGDTDGTDFLIWQRQFAAGSLAAPSNDVVPEPTASLCALVAISAALVRSRQARRCGRRRRD